MGEISPFPEDRAVSTATLPRRAYLSQVQAAEILGVTERTIRNYVSRGELPAYRVGGRVVRIDPADLEKLLHRIPTAGGHREAG